MRTVSLREVDWDNQGGGFKTVEYPAEIVEGFVNWLRTTSQWREDPGQVYDKFRRMELDLTDVRNARVTVEPGRCAAATAAGVQCKREAGEDGVCGVHRRAAA